MEVKKILRGTMIMEWIISWIDGLKTESPTLITKIVPIPPYLLWASANLRHRPAI